jgi:CheY-like chemotaxis protein
LVATTYFLRVPRRISFRCWNLRLSRAFQLQMFALPTNVPTSSHTALIVEDEFLVRFDIEDALSQAGVNIIAFATGEEALDWLAHGNKADVLVTDIRLGEGLDGLEIARRFHAACPESGVIYLSATPPDPGQQMPGSRFLPKPYPNERLVSAVRTMLSPN